MRFQKWQGTGNHHVVVEAALLPWAMTAARAVVLCDPHTGVGADGVLEIGWDGGHPRMTVWNADGSVAENCGNGIRIVAAYLHADGRLPDDGLVLTGATRTWVTMCPDGRVRVRMGRAVLPAGAATQVLRGGRDEVRFTEVSMGNPHAVISHADPDAVAGALGPAVEVDPRFPQRTNVEFMRVEGDGTLTLRVWERGVGLTQACGTGACAAAVAAVTAGETASPVTVHLPGGDLVIEVDAEMDVTMTGPAEQVFSGRTSPALRARLDAADRGAGVHTATP
ncbi:MAG: diaminopimelate epimerase [Thermoleophilia bacterium]